jgi:hypothetical protein
LGISLKTVGTQPRDLLVGYDGVVDLYNVEFTGHAPGHQPQPVFDPTALKALPSSVLLPISAHLQPSEIREFLYPLSQMICVVNRKDVPFRPLLERSYTVRASFGFPGVTHRTPYWPARH